MSEAFEVVVRLISNAAIQGVVEYNGRRYLVELGWLTHIRDDLYTINIGYLLRERQTFI